MGPRPAVRPGALIQQTRARRIRRPGLFIVDFMSAHDVSASVATTLADSPFKLP